MISKEMGSPSDIDLFVAFLTKRLSKDDALKDAQALGLDIQSNQFVETEESVSGVIDLNKLLGFDG